MGIYLLRRLVQLVPVAIGITVISFGIILLAPGDPVALLVDIERTTPEQQAQVRRDLGLDQPFHVQYLNMARALVTGELRSFRTRQRTAELVAERLPTTLTLTALALSLSLTVGIVLAILSATRPYSGLDDLLTVASLAGVSLPNFWFALILIFIFGETLRVLPAGGIRPATATEYNPLEMAPYVVLPTIVLASGILPSVMRYARSSLLDVLAQDYVRTARGKGLAEETMLVRHALRNALIPVVTMVGMLLPLLIGGAVVVETIFALPGVGRLAIEAVQVRDFPVVMTLNLFMAVLVLVCSLVSDLAYAVVDPRVRYD